MQKLPAHTGLLWIKEGLLLFRKQPAEVSTLFLSYMFCMLVLGFVPVLGQLLPLILIPAIAMTFMHACRHIEEDKRVYPNLLLVSFRSPAVRSLLMLGVLYLLATSAAVAIASVVDGGVVFNAITNPEMGLNAIGSGSLRLTILVAAIVYLPAQMAFWFAAPLIAWHNMSLGKALFFSFFTVVRAGKAFVVYGLAWLLTCLLLPFVVSGIAAMLFRSPTVVLFILMPLSVILSVIMYCTFYPIYTCIFGRPWQSDTTVAESHARPD